jgi:hypothetical protein
VGNDKVLIEIIRGAIKLSLVSVVLDAFVRYVMPLAWEIHKAMLAKAY